VPIHSDFSIAIWAWIETGSFGIQARGVGDPRMQFELYQNGDISVRTSTNSDTFSTSVSKPDISTGFHHIALTVDTANVTAKLYYDGVEQSPDPAITLWAISITHLRMHLFTSGARIHSLKYWSTPITQEHVTADYNALS